MTRLLSESVQPLIGVGNINPYEPHEIDAHPDADRIWATILAIRAEAEYEVNMYREGST